MQSLSVSVAMKSLKAIGNFDITELFMTVFKALHLKL
jgi:hypothetical protein